MCHLNPQFVRFVWFTLNLFLSLFVAEGLIHVISALVPFFIIGLVAAAGIYGTRYDCVAHRVLTLTRTGGFMLTEGFFLVRGNIPKWWIWMYYIGFHSYSFESFMYNEFSGTHTRFVRSHFSCVCTDVTFSYSQGSPWSGSQNDTVSGMDVLKLYEMGTDHRVLLTLVCRLRGFAVFILLPQARDMAILAGMALAYRVAYYLVLKVLHTGKR